MGVSRVTFAEDRNRDIVVTKWQNLQDCTGRHQQLLRVLYYHRRGETGHEKLQLET